MSRNGLRYAIDSICCGSTLGVSGWIFAEKDSVIAISMRVGDGERASLEMGLPRSDVAARFPRHPGAELSGFRGRRLPVTSEGKVVIQVDLDSGRREKLVLGNVDQTGFHPAPAMPQPRPARYSGLDFSFMEAILRAVSPQPQPLPSLVGAALIIVPVYGALEFLPAFFQSLFADLPLGCRVVIVDDGNSDGQLTKLLEHQAESHPGTILEKLPRNMGYVEAIWAGFQHRRDEHVVVVNTDTVLPPHWLVRLLAPLADPCVASVTPFSNCGSICGFPQMPEDNGLWLGLSPECIDLALRCIDRRAVRLPLPSGVGYCMAMSASALDAIGFIERETFGKGYGEENDWSQRAAKAGMDNLLAPDLFVWHRHGGSFPAEEKLRLMERNLAIVNHRHPAYADDVNALIFEDPLAPLRHFMAFKLAAEHHPLGAVLHDSPLADDPAPRPSIRRMAEPDDLAWDWHFSAPGLCFRLGGGNVREWEELHKRLCLKII